MHFLFAVIKNNQGSVIRGRHTAVHYIYKYLSECDIFIELRVYEQFVHVIFYFNEVC